MSRRNLPLVVIVAIVLLTATSGDAHARKVAPVDTTCPLCEHRFVAYVDISGTQFDTRLDLRPIGAIGSPALIPVCPKCRFVIYQDAIPEKELEACRKVVNSEDYRKQSDRPPYFLLAILFEGIHKDPLTTGFAFLRASWQEEGDVDKYRENAKRARRHFRTYLKTAQAHDESWRNIQLASGDLLRRAGKFRAAQKHFERIAAYPELGDSPERTVIGYQLELISRRDKAPHTYKEALHQKERRPEVGPRPLVDDFDLPHLVR